VTSLKFCYTLYTVFPIGSNDLLRHQLRVPPTHLSGGKD